MKPILFDEKQTSFVTNGIGRLTDCSRCEVTEVRNGEFELEAVYPVTGELFDEIRHSRIIGVNTHKKGSIQAFRIYKITRPMAGNVTIYARHISYQLSYIAVKPFTASTLNNALIGYKQNSVDENPFTFQADFSSDRNYSVPLPNTIRACIGGDGPSLLNIYGGEVEWDNWAFKLHQNRGSDKGEQIRYGKNLIDIQQEENIENTITGIYGYWNSDEASVYMDHAIYSDNADNFPFKRTAVVDLSSEFSDKPTVEQMEEYVRNYISENGIGIPEISISVNFVDLSTTKEYKELLPSQDIQLCDIVTVEFEKLGVKSKAEVVKVVWDVLQERYSSIEVGEVKRTIASTIEEALTTAQSKPSETAIQSIIDKATGVLNAGRRGHVIINRNEEGWANEILFMDTESIATAKNVLRINMNGLGFSTTGYNGIYEQAWTIDGNLIADFITTGRIQGKDLTNFWDMDTGEFHITSDDEEYGIIYKNGKLQINASSVTIGSFDGGLIAEGSVQGGSIADGAISNTKLTADSITTDKIKVGAITAAKIHTEAVTTETIRADAITTAKIKAEAITAEKLHANSVTAEKIEADAVIAEKIRVDAITGKHIRGGNIEIGEFKDKEGHIIEANFIVDSEGNLTAHEGKFYGDISAGPLEVTEDEVCLGVFKVTTDKTAALTTSNGDVYISSNTPGSSDQIPYMKIQYVTDDGEDNYKKTRVGADFIEVPDIYITGRNSQERAWWDGWSLTRTFMNIYDRIEALESSSDDGGDDE